MDDAMESAHKKESQVGQSLWRHLPYAALPAPRPRATLLGIITSLGWAFLHSTCKRKTAMQVHANKESSHIIISRTGGEDYLNSEKPGF